MGDGAGLGHVNSTVCDSQTGWNDVVERNQDADLTAERDP